MIEQEPLPQTPVRPGDASSSPVVPLGPPVAPVGPAAPLDPLRYPWDPPTHAEVVDDDRSWRLDVRPGRRLGQATAQGATGSRSVNRLLVESNAAPVDARFLVVAVGSNASSDVMRRKFARTPETARAVFPVIDCVVTGIAVGHSAHVSVGGYVAAAPFAEPGAETHLWAALLDATQLAVLDATEPNYDRTWVDAADHPIVLGSGERPVGYHLYRSIHGVLATATGPDGLRPQPELLTRLEAAGAPVASDPRSAVEVLRTSAAARERLTEWLHDHQRQDDGVVGTTGGATRTYGETADLAASASPAALVVRASPNTLHRAGEQCVVVHPDDAGRLGLGKHVVVSNGERTDRPGVLVRLHRDPAVERGTIGVDQVVRNGLGVERQETATIRRARVLGRPLVDLFLGRSAWVMCRVQAADLASVEQDVALLDTTALQLLGVNRGEPVVIEGVPDRVEDPTPVVRLRAVELDESVATRREQLAGGGLEARFPSASDALGVFPDLPQVFLDAAQRNTLGLGAHKLAAVRVRASRSAQLGTQIREVLLVLVLAFIGLASIFQDVVVVSLLLAAVVAVAGAVVIGRLRTQLGLRQLWERRRR